MPKNSKYGFFELGMNHPGEISKLTKILQPEIAIILNIENVHIGNFHSLKEIAKAKSEIFSATKSVKHLICLLYTSPSPRDRTRSRMPSSA